MGRRVLAQSWPFPWRRHRHERGAWAALGAWTALAGVLVLAFLLRITGDRWVLPTIPLYMGRWIWLVPVGGAILLAALRRPAALLPALAALAVVVGPIMGGRTGWRTLLPAPVGMPLRVVTLNAAGSGRIARDLPALLAEWRAEVVALQECPALLRDRRSLDGDPALEGWQLHVEVGLCLLSRFPIREVAVMDRSALQRARDGAGGAGRGSGAGFVVRYTLDARGRPLGITNIHLETARKGLEGLTEGRLDLGLLRENIAIREIESRRARAFAEGGVRPMIVVGDFNAPHDSRNLRVSWAGFASAFDRVGRGFGYTRLNGWIRLRIDHQLHTDEVIAVRAVIGRDVGSDHRPLIVDYRVP